MLIWLSLMMMCMVFMFLKICSSLWLLRLMIGMV